MAFRARSYFGMLVLSLVCEIESVEDAVGFLTRRDQVDVELVAQLARGREVVAAEEHQARLLDREAELLSL